MKITTMLIVMILVVPLSLGAIKTYYVEETDFVTVTPEAMDLDNDQVTYSYGPPLDEFGEWQTTLQDAGEYEVELTASDGLDQSTKKIKIIVADKNEPPYLIKNKLTISETDIIDLSALVIDPNNDALTYKFPPPFNAAGIWQTGYMDAGKKLVEFTISDGEFTTPARVEITIQESNQPPIISEKFTEGNIKLAEDDTLNFFVKAKDPEGNRLTYTWILNKQIIATTEAGTHYFAYDSAGTHQLTLVVNDSLQIMLEEWTIEVANKNRRPELKLLPITVFEGDDIRIDLPATDADGEILSYTFERPLNNGFWQTTYDDAGIYSLEIEASDGELSTSQPVHITILDVDRPPTLHVPRKTNLIENQSWSMNIISSDPDNDPLTITFDGLPEGVRFDGKNLTWKPGYNVVQRKGGFFSDILNGLRLEHFLGQKRTFPVKVSSCGRELCTRTSFDLIVHNSNRPPVLSNPGIIRVKETSLAKINITASDPDGDLVKLYFSTPVGKRNGQWQTQYGDKGEYAIQVTASDGKRGNTLDVPLVVDKLNRQPHVQVNHPKVEVNELEEFTLRVSVQDPDSNNLTLLLEHLPPGASFAEGVFIWSPPSDTTNEKSSTVWLSFIGSDEEFDVVVPVEVTVKNVNQKPQIIDFLPVGEPTVKVNDPVLFHVAAKDAEDNLTYTWEFGLGHQTVAGSDTIERTFTYPGKKKVRVTVNDGHDQVAHEFKLNVYETEVTAPVPAPAKVRKQQQSFRVYVIDH